MARRAGQGALGANAKNDPHVRCLPANFLRAYGMPHLLKFVQTPGLLLVLNEWNAGYRQVFTDGRPLPEDPTRPGRDIRRRSGRAIRWSSTRSACGTTSGSTGGSVVTEAAKVREEIRRPDLGHLEIQCDR